MTLSGPNACFGSTKEARTLAAFLHSPEKRLVGSPGPDDDGPDDNNPHGSGLGESGPNDNGLTYSS